ncbi:hypothetical protein [Comamonas kerstersii]|uniref:hypothetical protein n=1 Tax=Comamonas kerstersii TaxID=225992 RepID=UPI000B265009|nr:hypothetical protein [Comamonas kerstersii]
MLSPAEINGLKAQSTKHKAQSTKHKAQSTKHKAQSTKHKAPKKCAGNSAFFLLKLHKKELPALVFAGFQSITNLKSRIHKRMQLCF